MQTVLSLSVSLCAHAHLPYVHPKPLAHKSPWNTWNLWHQSAIEGRRKSSTGAVQYLPAICPDIVIREARPEDYWEVAETHCSSFFPDHGFPMDLVLRADRLVAMFSGFSIPRGCRKKCLVASNGNFEENRSVESESYENVEAGLKLHLNDGKVSGILTIDTIAEFLPRRGPLGKRRYCLHFQRSCSSKKAAKRRRSKISHRSRSFSKELGLPLHCFALRC